MAVMKRFEGLGFWALPLSGVYALGLLIHRGLYTLGILPRYRAHKPVMAIGNIVAGGVGKTPMTVWVCEALKAKGKKPAVILRGYKAHQGLSDEAMMLKEILPDVPVVTGASRVESIKTLAQLHPHLDVIVCDDAFQHWPLHRNLDIVLIDATNPFGNNQLLPAGVLREPKKALKRAHIIVVTKSDDDKPFKAIVDQIKLINPTALIVRARHKMHRLRNIFTQEDIHFTPQQSVLAISTIADPDAFYRTLSVMGLKIDNVLAWADHAPYTPEMIEIIKAKAQSMNNALIVTTHKDAVKLLPYQGMFQPLNCACVDIRIDVLQGQGELIDQLLKVCDA